MVEYSLAGYQNPIGVVEWKNKMVQVLPEALKSSLSSIEEIEKELNEQGVWRNHKHKKTTAEGELSFCFGIAPGIRKKGRKPNAFLYEVEMKKGRENISTDKHSIARYKDKDV